MSRRTGKHPLWHPFLWPTWLALGLMRLLTLLPWSIQIALGRIFGRITFFLLRERRKIIRINLRLGFPELGEKQIRKMATVHHEAMGIGLFETCMAWWAPASRMPKYEIQGLEHLAAAQARGKGVILLTAHFTTLEICGRYLSETLPIGCLFRDPDNAVVAREMHRQRLKKMTVAIPMDDLRGLIRALKNGSTIWYAPDQSKKSKFSSIVPFFGEPALTNTATSRLSGMTGAAVVPYFAFRLEDGTYRLEILPALENFPTDDPVADALRTNRLMEDAIRLHPDQYFWVHRRYKKRGKQFPNVYPEKRRRKKRKKKSSVATLSTPPQNP
ncbi:MAG: hypothetical protein QM627_06855 [Luteolibacter sp.]